MEITNKSKNNMKGGSIMMNNKNGVSAVVATVLIIMITVAAVGIIWAAIIPMIRTSIDRGTACFDAQSDISVVTDQGYTCLNTTTSPDNLSIQVKKGPNTKISLVGIEAIVFVNGNSVKYRFNATQSNTSYGGILPGNNEEKVLYIADAPINGATRLKIAPVVTVGRTEEVCEVSQDVVLSACP